MKNAMEPRFINTILSVLMEEVECGSALFVWLSRQNFLELAIMHIQKNKILLKISSTVYFASPELLY